MKTFIIALLIPMFLLSAPRDIQVIKLHHWFVKYDSPLVGYEQDFVDMAKEFELDYRLLPAIATQESQCGNTNIAENNNPFGYGSDEIKFCSYKAAIWYVGWQLAYGQYYQGKSLDKKLYTYNQNVGYGQKIKSIMRMISD
jgi:hypothetical protein